MAILVTLVLLVAGCQCGVEETNPATETTLTPEGQAPEPELPSTPTSAQAPEETVMTIFESTEHGFSIEYPEGWVENTHGATTSFQFQFKESQGNLSVGVSVDYRAEEIGLTDAISEVKGYMESNPQFEMFSEGDVTISDGISAYEMIGQGDIGAGKLEKFRYVILVRGKQVLFVGVSGEPDLFDEQKPLVDSIMDSFKLLPEYTYVPPISSPGGTYTSTEYGFSITYPTGWSDYTTGEYGEILDLRAAVGIPEVMIKTWTGGETALAEEASQLKSMFSEQLGDYEFLSEGEIALDDGTTAYEVLFNGTMGGYFLTCKYVIVITEANNFLLMGFSLPGSFELDEPVLDEVIGSFHLE